MLLLQKKEEWFELCSQYQLVKFPLSIIIIAIIYKKKKQSNKTVNSRYFVVFRMSAKRFFCKSALCFSPPTEFPPNSRISFYTQTEFHFTSLHPSLSKAEFSLPPPSPTRIIFWCNMDKFNTQFSPTHT